MKAPISVWRATYWSSMIPNLIQPPDADQDLVNELGDICAALGWNDRMTQTVNIFHKHNCEMFSGPDGRWMKLCRCGTVVGQTRREFLAHVIEFLRKEHHVPVPG